MNFYVNVLRYWHLSAHHPNMNLVKPLQLNVCFFFIFGLDLSAYVMFLCFLWNFHVKTNLLTQQFPTFLAAGTGFVEDNFFPWTRGLGGMVSGWFKGIIFTVPFISIIITF